MAESNDPAWPNGTPTVGETAERSRTVEREDLERFTEISGDRNPLHYDEEAGGRPDSVRLPFREA